MSSTRSRDGAYDDEWSECIARAETRASYHPNLRGIARDHEFLSRVREAAIDDLIELAQTCVNGPAWRQVAVARALARMPRKRAQRSDAERRR